MMISLSSGVEQDLRSEVSLKFNLRGYLCACIPSTSW